MMITTKKRHIRPTALLISATMLAPILAGCGGKDSESKANMPPIDDTRSSSSSATRPADPPKTGMSTGKKVAILAGAAAVYYLYKRSQSKKTEGADGKYYLSKNGRVYYRDQQGQAHWVTPPPQPVEIPQDEANQYPELNRYRGYNNQATGEAFGGV